MLNHHKNTIPRLEKQVPAREKVEQYLKEYAYNHAFTVLSLAGLCLLMIFFTLAYCLVGATDSGLIYNHLMNGGI